MKKLEGRWRSDLTTTEVVQLLVDTAGISDDHSSDQEAPSRETKTRSSSTMSSLPKGTVVDLYRFTSAKKGMDIKNTAAGGYKMEYFRSPDDLTRSI